MKHGCPSPASDAIRARVPLGTTTSLITLLPIRPRAGGWMIWVQSVDNADLVINLDMGRAIQARQFTVPAQDFRVFTIPSSSPVKIRGLHRAFGTATVDIACWPVDQVRWANPEFQVTGAATTNVDFVSQDIGQIPNDADRVMLEVRSTINTSVAAVELEGVDRGGRSYQLGQVPLAAVVTQPRAAAAVFNIVPGFFSRLAVSSAGIAAETVRVDATVYRSAR